MKRTLYSLFISFTIIFVSSCEKEQIIADEPTQTISSVPTAHLMKINKFNTYTPSEFVEKLSKSTYASWIGLEEYLSPVLSSFVATRSPELWTIFARETNNLSASNWRIEQINFDYRTVDVKGDSVTLSGIICYPNNTVGKHGHELSSISLVCHTFYNYNTDCPSFKGDITMGRALWNSLVVIPDMQGYGSSKNLGDGMKLSNSCARQVVDCERVAIGLIKSRGLTLKEDYYTNIMGYSLGAGVMTGVAKWMEECSDEDKQLFRYNTAFVGGGVFNNFDYMAFYFRKPKDEVSYFSNAMPTIVYLVDEKELEGYKPEDFWSPQYTEILDTIEGRPTSPSTFTLWRNDETADVIAHKAKIKAFFGTPEARDILAEDMNTERLVMDPSTPKTKILKKLCDKEIPYTGWTPTHPITIYHPSNDEQVPFSLAENAYNTLRLSDPEGKFVKLKTFEIPLLSSIQVSPHYVGTALAQLRMLINEDPSKIVNTELLEYLINRIASSL